MEHTIRAVLEFDIEHENNDPEDVLIEARNELKQKLVNRELDTSDFELSIGSTRKLCIEHMGAIIDGEIVGQFSTGDQIKVVAEHECEFYTEKNLDGIHH